ncbi:MAG: AraC family transcriptional regulator [Eubacteriales bacterium]|nr:AraC family transcriptional regulator [Eubacteriales bacterium]
MDNIDKNLTIDKQTSENEQKSRWISLKTYDGMYIRRCTNVNCIPHVNIQAEVFVVFSGKVRILCNSREFIVCAGEAFFVNSLSVHAFFSVGESSAAVIMFNIDEFPPIEKRTDRSELVPNKTKLSDEMIDKIKLSMVEDDETVAYDEIDISAMIYPLFSEIFRQNKVVEASDIYTGEILIKALRIMAEKYDTDLSLDSVAHMVGIHPVHLGRCIKKRLGDGFVNILSSIRVDKAMHMLSSTSFKISDIAYLCGFGSVRNFNRAFLKICKMTPAEWRKASANVLGGE